MSDLLRRMAAGFRRSEVEVLGESIKLRSLSAAGAVEMADATAAGESGIRQNARILSLCIVDDQDHRVLTTDEAMELPPHVFQKILEAAIRIIQPAEDQNTGNEAQAPQLAA